MPSSTVVIVGAGPRGAGVLERLAASAPELHPGGLDVHLVDPYPPGAGRIWRHAQSPLLAMNSMAADVTMYTDESVVCDGPIAPGPSFWEWAQLRPVVDADLADELAAVTPTTFPSRQLQSAYLGWVLQDVIARRPAGMRVSLHRDRVVGLSDEGDTQVVRLEHGPPLHADAVVLASGHLDATPTVDELALAARAAAAGLRYLPPEQTTDTDLSVIAPGERVLVRGLGLAFVDLVVLLYEGRGGRFEPDGDGLRYVPSGAEPYLVAGSPRGAPYHSKTHYPLRAGRPPLPRFFGPAQVDPLLHAGEPVDMLAQVWPLMAKEIAWGWYHELALGHPELVGLPWPAFAERFAALGWGTPAMEAFLAETVPDPLDRLDLAALDRPLDGVRADSLDALQPLVQARIAEDLRQHVDERHTPHLGAFVAMLSVYAELGRLAEVLTARSEAFDMGWWQSFFNSVASGPPGFRVRQILALARAGFVRFVGPGMRVDIADGAFRATLRRDPRRRDGAGARRRAPARPERVPLDRPARRRAPAGGGDRRARPRRRRRRRAAQHRPDPGPPGRRRARRRGRAGAPAAVRGGPAHVREGRGRVHPPGHERAEPALQRRRRPRGPAQPAHGGGGPRGLTRPPRRQRAPSARPSPGPPPPAAPPPPGATSHTFRRPRRRSTLCEDTAGVRSRPGRRPTGPRGPAEAPARLSGGRGAERGGSGPGHGRPRPRSARRAAPGTRRRGRGRGGAGRGRRACRAVGQRGRGVAGRGSDGGGHGDLPAVARRDRVAIPPDTARPRDGTGRGPAAG